MRKSSILLIAYALVFIALLAARGEEYHRIHLEPGQHELFGWARAYGDADRNWFVMDTRSRKALVVDEAAAHSIGNAVGFRIGEPLRVVGTYKPNGSLLAVTVNHAEGPWESDR